MALPVLKSVKECGDYSKTVEPFIPQLYDLPYRVLDNVGSIDGLLSVYTDTNPLITAFGASVVLSSIFLVVSEINRNYSQVDRLWSLLPNLYIVHLAVWARLAGVSHSRIDLVATFSTLWSARLTYNYWRKGGYTVGSEDYRWAVLQKYVPRFVWFIFNLAFISSIQTVLLFSISCIPAYAILLSTQFDEAITTADLSYFAIELVLVLSEWFSDGQMWNYQTAKHKYKENGKIPEGFHKKDLDRGFITSGLFAYSRHPNFLAEQTVWFALYQWSCYATNNFYSWTGIGSGALMLLFQGSTWLTELITAQKYPEYKYYKSQVGMFVPTSISGYKGPTPKVIRTSELGKRQEENEKQK
ncbi:Protein of unknown function (DUF1295) [Geosmithia morbida]|uniref:DUF1295-domain-containing protein n=1 Tax=Geosmithia morbida TaxID=1094350 RepID=A0A9P4YQB9_9HYPO|nr:Protein of unknown function (DUF1295) [Geosmithia morbida]KAF4121178.1 Protein of unknown function (DUF1295) [Geosmithia morbida]